MEHTQENTPLQRRTNPRFLSSEIAVEVESIKHHTIGKGKSININEQGLSGVFDQPFTLSERVIVRMKFPESDTICECKGKVMWGTANSNNFIHGISYVLPENDHALIQINKYMKQNVLTLTKDERRSTDRRNRQNLKGDEKRRDERRTTKPILKKCISSSRIDFLNQQRVFFREFSTFAKPHVIMEGRDVICFSYCNYLGLNNDPRVKKALIDSVNEHGTTTASSRLLGGTITLHNELEKRIATFLKVESSLTYAMGYLANQGCISSIVGMNDSILFDENSHGSIIDGVVLSRGNMVSYKHSDMKDLERKLKKTEGGKLIVTDGVFSMDGDVAKLNDIYELGQKYEAAIMVDDAHGLGVLGKTGGGTVEHFGLEGKIDIIMGTLSKSIPLIGGFIAGRKKIIEYLKWSSRQFILNMSLPPYVAQSSIEVINIIENSPELRKKLWDNINYMKHGIQSLGFNIGLPEAGIITLAIGDHKKTYSFSEKLEEHSILVDAVSYPAVKKQDSKLRFVITAEHSKDDIDKTLHIVEQIGRELEIIP